MKNEGVGMKRFLFLALVCLGLGGCDSGRIYESNVKIPDEGWQRAELARFEVEIADTLQSCNIYINVRNNSSYKYMDFWLFVNVHSPMGLMERDTIRIMLADHRGKWLGGGLGSKFDTRMVFRKDVRFPMSGKFVFEYEQGMRDEPLIGIEDIGIRIERNE